MFWTFLLSIVLLLLSAGPFRSHFNRFFHLFYCQQAIDARWGMLPQSDRALCVDEHANNRIVPTQGLQGHVVSPTCVCVIFSEMLCKILDAIIC